jgi:hypothetical protein
LLVRELNIKRDGVSKKIEKPEIIICLKNCSNFLKKREVEYA